MAMDDAKLLPPNSTLITNTSRKRPMWIHSNNIMVMQSALDDQDNPFLRFASYIITHPDTLSFALITNDGKVKKFIAPIEHIEVIQNNSNNESQNSSGFYTPESIEAYQQRYISSFIKFLQENQEFVSSENQIKISKTIETLSRQEWQSKHINREDYLSRLDTPLMLRRLASNLDAVTSTAERYPEQVSHINFASQSPLSLSVEERDSFELIRDIESIFNNAILKNTKKRQLSQNQRKRSNLR